MLSELSTGAYDTLLAFKLTSSVMFARTEFLVLLVDLRPEGTSHFNQTLEEVACGAALYVYLTLGALEGSRKAGCGGSRLGGERTDLEKITNAVQTSLVEVCEYDMWRANEGAGANGELEVSILEYRSRFDYSRRSSGICTSPLTATASTSPPSEVALTDPGPPESVLSSVDRGT